MKTTAPTEREATAYMYDAGLTLVRQKAAFHLTHPEVTTIDVMLLVEVTVNGEPVTFSYAMMESTRDQAEVDVKNTQRQIEFCRKFLEANSESVNTMSSTS